MMLTSADRQGDLNRCRQLGVAAYLVKPVKQSELLDVLLEVLGGVPPSVRTPPEARQDVDRPEDEARVGSGLRVLLVEDNLVNQRLAARLLEKRGHLVVVVGNGREALAALERQSFDLVLMDVQMPDMDGFEAAAAIRAREQQTGGHVPIVAMTAHVMKGDRERCLAAGMDDYIGKPIQVNELYAAITRLAHRGG